MSHTLKDKLIEFRNLWDRNEFNRTLKDERRREYERTRLESALQQYRNDLQRESHSKYGSHNLQNNRMIECDMYKNLKESAARKKIVEENKQTEEMLAKTLRKLEDNKIMKFQQRLILRNSEPELRDLADKIREKINGNILASQIATKRKQNLMEVAQERQIEYEVLQADLEAEARDLQKQQEKAMAVKEEMLKAMHEQRNRTRAKDKEMELEKEDNKRLIDELVMEENAKIAREEEIRRQKRDKTAAEYRDFLVATEERKKQQALDDKIWEEQLLAERNRLNDRHEAFEQMRKDEINARIQLREKMGEYTHALHKALEKEREAYLEASETLARAQLGLSELEYSREQEMKKKQLAEEMQEHIKIHRAIREKERQEELDYEREMDRQHLEAMRRDFNERKAKEQAKREKFTREIKEQMELRKQLFDEEQERIRQEDAQDLARIREHEDRVKKERQAMLAEYEQYVNYWTKCNDLPKSAELPKFKFTSNDCD